jgi:hypothetical protein
MIPDRNSPETGHSQRIQELFAVEKETCARIEMLIAMNQCANYGGLSPLIRSTCPNAIPHRQNSGIFKRASQDEVSAAVSVFSVLCVVCRDCPLSVSFPIV